MYMVLTEYRCNVENQVGHFAVSYGSICPLVLTLLVMLLSSKKNCSVWECGYNLY